MRAGESESKSTYTGEQITHVLLAVLFFFRKREQEKNIVGACRSHCHHHHQKSCCMWLGAAANLVGVVSVCCELFRLRYTFWIFLAFTNWTRAMNKPNVCVVRDINSCGSYTKFCYCFFFVFLYLFYWKVFVFF